MGLFVVNVSHDIAKVMWDGMNTASSKRGEQRTESVQYIAEQAAQLLLRQFRETHVWWQYDYVPLD